MKNNSKQNIFWKILANTWALLTMAFFILEFFLDSRFQTIAPISAIIYIAILGIYVGTKEFDRWQGRHSTRYIFGEFFVVLWTIVIIGVLIISCFNGYSVPKELSTTYIAVLGIFAITRKSRSLYFRREQK